MGCVGLGLGCVAYVHVAVPVRLGEQRVTVRG